ncbi:MAG TPA: hypothetical protein IGS53_09110 [Leptolyngbyaceae cyanobacterium M33_DOE_097]|uniref:Uncharacterized protein n=1 Tax=Oscillatoriales cyanobacterium SpSt-418 TaxID=2282169 RepID=A0A7C3PFK4_9CYAN|nr:hypothetical protein [Leptolyngbyaceae cyanobacterium M33_DOE_097]
MPVLFFSFTYLKCSTALETLRSRLASLNHSALPPLRKAAWLMTNGGEMQSALGGTGDRACNRRLTSPVLSVNDQSVALVTRNRWLVDHSTPIRTTLRGS